MNLIHCNFGTQDLKAMTLAELFGALVCSRDEEEIEDIVIEIKKRLDGPLGLQIIVSDEVTTSALLCVYVCAPFFLISSSSMQMQQYLAAGLTAVNEMVRELALNQLARCTTNEKGLAVLVRTVCHPPPPKSLFFISIISSFCCPRLRSFRT